MSKVVKFKSMQPKDWFPDRVKFPCLIQPKVDGVASYNRDGEMVGRSTKPHANPFVTDQFSVPEFHGFCGELFDADLGSTHWELCRTTSGSLRREYGEPNIKWMLFDYCTDEIKELPYLDRIALLKTAVDALPAHLRKLVEVIESQVVHNMEELLAWEDKYLTDGYEGAILRDMNAPFKYGNCGKTFMGAWRIKRFIDAECIVTSITEGLTNENEAKVNGLGRTERSTNKENMIPNGTLGNLKGYLVADILDPQTGEVIIAKGEEITVGPGEMDHKMRKFYFDNPGEILKKLVKFKLFPKGVKDKPRFATFITIRNENDI